MLDEVAGVAQNLNAIWPPFGLEHHRCAAVVRAPPMVRPVSLDMVERQSPDVIIPTTRAFITVVLERFVPYPMSP